MRRKCRIARRRFVVRTDTSRAPIIEQTKREVGVDKYFEVEIKDVFARIVLAPHSPNWTEHRTKLSNHGRGSQTRTNPLIAAVSIVKIC